MTDLACVVTNGGPLIALPREIVDAWRGDLPGDGDVVSDYERACDWPPTAFVVDDSWPAWPVSVGDLTALVLDGECGTSALPSEDGLVIVRDAGLASEEDVAGWLASVADWIDTGFDLDLRGGGLFVFDAAYPGIDRERADGGVMDIAVTPGMYRLRFAYPPATQRTTFLRLVGSNRANARITVR